MSVNWFFKLVSLISSSYFWKLRGALMDDAMILPCGHSFGAAGVQQVIRAVSSCYNIDVFLSELVV